VGDDGHHLGITVMVGDMLIIIPHHGHDAGHADHHLRIMAMTSDMMTIISGSWP
jgi:hypothetical protein